MNPLEHFSRGDRLNNCIGRSNYRFFVALLLSTFFMTSIQLGLSAWFVVKFHSSGNQEFSDRGDFFRLCPCFESLVDHVSRRMFRCECDKANGIVASGSVYLVGVIACVYVTTTGASRVPCYVQQAMAAVVLDLSRN